jgi:hypothetical protein
MSLVLVKDYPLIEGLYTRDVSNRLIEETLVVGPILMMEFNFMHIYITKKRRN